MEKMELVWFWFQDTRLAEILPHDLSNFKRKTRSQHEVFLAKYSSPRQIIVTFFVIFS